MGSRTEVVDSDFLDSTYDTFMSVAGWGVEDL
ncbi:MAG: hypothetical protein JWP95_632 [Actinotalea sp.]|nr:hypothetical protein [Actinotalea sp.]